MLKRRSKSENVARPGLWPCGVSAARVGRFSSVNDRSSGDICHTVRSPSDLFLSLLLIVLFFSFGGVKY